MPRSVEFKFTWCVHISDSLVKVEGAGGGYHRFNT